LSVGILGEVIQAVSIDNDNINIKPHTLYLLEDMRVLFTL